MTRDKVMRYDTHLSIYHEKYKICTSEPAEVVFASDFDALSSERDGLAERVRVLEEALKNLLVMLPSGSPDHPSSERIPAGFCFVRWQDISEARLALNGGGK